MLCEISTGYRADNRACSDSLPVRFHVKHARLQDQKGESPGVSRETLHALCLVRFT